MEASRTLSQNDAAGVLRAEAARRSPPRREGCPPPAHLIAMFTSIQQGLDRLSIVDHFLACGHCLRELDALTALHRGRRDVEIAPLPPESLPRRGWIRRLAASLRAPSGGAGGERGVEAARRAVAAFQSAVRTAIDRLGPGIGLSGDRVAGDLEIGAIPEGAAPEVASRSAVRAAYETAAERLLEASRRREGSLDAGGPATSPPADSPARRDEAALAGVSTPVCDAVARLAERRRQVVLLHLLGLRIPEIAILLSFSDDQARNLLLRGLDELAKALSADGIVLE